MEIKDWFIILSTGLNEKKEEENTTVADTTKLLAQAVVNEIATRLAVLKG